MEELVSKYIQNTERVLAEAKIARSSIRLDEEKIRSILEHAKSYLDDAKHYRTRKELATSLTAVAYCEGLLDALRLLGSVEFSW